MREKAVRPTGPSLPFLYVRPPLHVRVSPRRSSAGSVAGRKAATMEGGGGGRSEGKGRRREDRGGRRDFDRLPTAARRPAGRPQGTAASSQGGGDRAEQRVGRRSVRVGPYELPGDQQDARRWSSYLTASLLLLLPADA